MNIPAFVSRPAPTDSEELFLVEAKQYPPLSRDEQLELGRRVQDHGDELAAKRQANHCLLLAYGVAKEVARRRKQPGRLMELLSVGLETLTRCSRRFDPELGVPFANYAARSMECQMRSYLNEHTRASRIPRDASVVLSRLRRFVVEYQELYGGFPSAAAIAAHEGISEAKAAEFIPHLQDEVSLDSAAPGGSERRGADLVIQVAADVEPADRPAEISSLRDALDLAMRDVLDEREQIVVRAFFGVGHGRSYELDEIGEMIGVSKERARQLKNDALAKMRAAEGVQGLREELAA